MKIFKVLKAIYIISSVWFFEVWSEWKTQVSQSLIYYATQKSGVENMEIESNMMFMFWYFTSTE